MEWGRHRAPGSPVEASASVSAQYFLAGLWHPGTLQQWLVTQASSVAWLLKLESSGHRDIPGLLILRAGTACWDTVHF
jgi:hypothetical protein